MNLSLHLPPSGRGIYAGNQSVDFLARFDFVVLPANRADTIVKAPELKRRGKRVWLYTGPEGWRPTIWPAEAARLETMAVEMGLTGFVADPENGWEDSTDAEATRLGSRLAEATGRTRVIVTSFPLMPHRRAMAAAARGRVVGSPQIYSDVGAAGLRAWQQDWATMFGRDMIVNSIAGWARRPTMESADGYQAYLDSLPPSVGYIAWTLTQPPEWRSAALLAHAPAPLPTRIWLEARGLLTTWQGIAGAILLAVIIAAAVYAAARR